MKSLSIITGITIFLAIFLGAVVRVTGSGLGCPDWPLCHGRLIPPPDLSAWIEWIHRFMVLISSISLLLFCFAGYLRVRRKIYFVPLVILLCQIILGAITVKTEIHPLAGVLHTIFASIYVIITFTLISSYIFKLNKELFENGQKLLPYSLVAVFITIASGAIVTRSSASLSSLDLPVPFSFSDDPALFNLQLIQTIHRVIAYMTFFIVMYYSHTMIKITELKLAAIMITTAVTLQVALGMLNIAMELQPIVQAMHIFTAFFLLSLLSLIYGSKLTLNNNLVS